MAKSERINTYITGTTIKHFTGESFARMPIPLPPMDEQNEIVCEVSAKLSQIEACESSIELDFKRAIRLRQSILNEAFKGKLVLQDENNQPATELLAKVSSDAELEVVKFRTIRHSSSSQRNIIRRRGAVVSYILSYSSDQSARKLEALGRTKLIKTLYMMQTHEDIDLQFHFQRYGAGPFDESIYQLEGVANKNGWFTKQDRERYGVTYHHASDTEILRQEAIDYLGDRRTAIDRLLDHFAKIDMTQAELFATTYAAWNDLLIDKREITNDSIIDEFYAWDESKQEFKRADIIKQIKWMQANGYVPTGKGQHTDKRTKETKLPSRKRRKSEA